MASARDDSCRLSCYKRPLAWACFMGAFSTEPDATSTVACAACEAGGVYVVSYHGTGNGTFRILWQRTAARVPFPLVREARWHHPGLLGCNSDASRPQGEGDHSRGLGGNAMTRLLLRRVV